MIYVLGKVSIEDLPKFISVFSTRGAQMRKKYGSASAQLFKELEEETKVVVLFLWESKDAFDNFVNDPTVKETMKSSGIKSPPEFTLLDKVADFPG